MEAIVRKNEKRATGLAILLPLLICLSVIESYAQVTMIRLKVSGANNALDETVLYYQTGASLGFDSEYDAYKLYGPTPNLAIAQVYDNIQMQINGISPVSNHMSMPVLVKSPNAGNYTMYATNFNNFPYGTCLSLRDNYTGESIDLKTHAYTFYLDDTTTTPRFSLEIDYMNMPLELTTIDASCNEPIGNYVAKGTGAGPWNYIWKDTSGTIIKNDTTAAADTFNINIAGSYRVFVESLDGCGYNAADFTIGTLVIPQASFMSLDTIILTDTNFFVASNNSVNSINYEWNLGDSSPVINNTDIQYHYADTGAYTVQLTAYSASGCSDVFNKIIYVAAQVIDTTVLSNVTDTTQASVGITSYQQPQTLKWMRIGEKKYLLDNGDVEVDTITIYDMNKRAIYAGNNRAAKSIIDLSNNTSGIYLIKIANGNREMYKSFMLF